MSVLPEASGHQVALKPTSPLVRHCLPTGLFEKFEAIQLVFSAKTSCAHQVFKHSLGYALLQCG